MSEPSPHAPVAVDLTIVIVNWNGAPLTTRCLDSIFSNLSSDVMTEVIVVDNGSAPGDYAALQGYTGACGIRLLRNDDNRGFARANNQGLASASGRYILLLNNDTEVRAGALGTLVGYMDTQPEAGIASPRLERPDGSLQQAYQRFPQPPWRLVWELLVDRFSGPQAAGKRQVQRFGDDDEMALHEVDWVVGAAMLVRREFYRQLGGLDEGYFMYAEDIDYCYRAHLAGWKVVYVPGATVMHIGRGSLRSRSNVARAMLRQRDRSLVRFYRMYHGGIAAFLMKCYLRVKHWPQG